MLFAQHSPSLSQFILALFPTPIAGNPNSFFATFLTSTTAIYFQYNESISDSAMTRHLMLV
jgi:hypothetical protein